ncbi:hypothetical protein BCR43DRAFT_475758 [Syncephalastrum racemosum]|uniref:Uncharacterized protein n=1 Tax=Syncephalastrum racemosum TaxID=13706 RepID=A0A1X2HAR3_SYNRA|nr:hypothetical protein BCR43DRAFT_475758 [Syncephalastrum racemosum]
MLSSEEAQYQASMASTDGKGTEWLQPDSDVSNTPKKKSMERISKLFQKKSKKQSTSSLTSSFSAVSLPACEYPTATTNNETQQPLPPSTVHALNSNTFNTNAPARSSSLRIPKSQNSDETQSSSNDSKAATPPSADGRPSVDEPTLTDEAAQCSSTADYEQQQQQQQQQYIQPTLAALSRGASVRSTNSAVCATSQSLKAQVARQQRILENLQIESEQYQKDSKVLQDRLDKMLQKKDQREADLKQLQQNYDHHIRSLRATPDDLDSVAAKIRQLKKTISDLAHTLSEEADAVIATRALSTFWLNLNTAIEAMGCPLPRPRLQMLTEKFMMDVLVQNLNLNVFPGVEILDAYNQLQYWLEDQQLPSAIVSVRLRQEFALLVARDEGNKESDVCKSRHMALQNSWKYLYSGLVKAYPFVYQHDKAEPDVRKHYGARVQVLVEQAISLGLAIKGQEVDVTAAAVAEGQQAYDPELMVDEDGQTSGIVQFCICPPFVVGNSPDPLKTLEKGRVLCSPH